MQYPSGDPLGQLLALLSLSPLALSLCHATFFLLTRDCHTLTFGVGTIANFALNSVLKRVIAEARPPASSLARHPHNHFSPYGMPSSHSQFIAFYVVYFNLFLFCRLSNIFGQKDKSSNNKVV